jgi:hypothetical protein
MSYHAAPMRTSRVLLLLLACPLACSSSSANDAGSNDLGTPLGDAASMDATQSSNDATPSDASAPDSGSSSDLGGQLMPRIDPGIGITFTEAQVTIGETLMAVQQALGAGTKSSGTTTRSYEWNLTGPVHVTVWFANDSLGTSGNTVQPTDKVLWISIDGTFPGKTDSGVGLGSSQASVQAAYGTSPHSVPLTMPAGTLDTYYTKGLLISYDTNNSARAVTVCRKYQQEPDGTIDVANAQLTFMSGSIRGGGPLAGDSMSHVSSILGPPDVSGPVNLGGTTFDYAGYTFIGIDIFLFTGAVEFIDVHVPYYGHTPPDMGMTFPNGVGVGGTKSDFEAYLTAIGFGPGGPSTIMGVTCYKMAGRAVGASYSSDMPPVVTSIVVALPTLACM